MSTCAATEEARERPFDCLLGSTTEAAFIVDTNTRVIRACNPAAERMFGGSAAEMIGRTTEILHVNDTAFRRFAGIARRAFEQGGVYSTHYAMRRRDGNVFAARIRIVPIATPEHLDLVLSLVRDETDLSTQREQLEQAVAQLAATEESRADRWVAVLERLAAEFDWDYGECWSSRGDRLRMEAHWAGAQTKLSGFLETRRSLKLKPGEGLPGRVWKTLEAEWLSGRTGKLAMGETADVEPMLLKTWFALPVVRDHQEVDVLLFASRSVRQPNEVVISLTRRASNGIAHLLGASKGRDTRSNEKGFARLFTLHPLPIWVCDERNLRIFDANHAALAVTGHDSVELTGKRYTDLLDSAGADNVHRRLPDADHGTRQIGNVPISGKGGGTTDLYLQMCPVVWKGHDAIAFLGIQSTELAPWLIDVKSSAGALETRLRTLTPRERQVLDLVMAGKSNKEIGRILQISPRTVEVYRATMMRKMEARSATHLLSMLTFNERLW